MWYTYLQYSGILLSVIVWRTLDLIDPILAKRWLTIVQIELITDQRTFSRSRGLYKRYNNSRHGCSNLYWRHKSVKEISTHHKTANTALHRHCHSFEAVNEGLGNIMVLWLRDSWCHWSERSQRAILKFVSISFRLLYSYILVMYL